MSCFLIGTIPVLGHLSPALTIAEELIKRKHQVWWYTGEAFRSMVEETGARFIPIQSGLDYSYSENVPESLLEARKALSGPAQLKFDLKHFFIDAAVGQMQDLEKHLQEETADVLLGDSFFLGASWVSQRQGIPWVSLGVSVLPFNSQDTAPFGLGISPIASPFNSFRNRILNWLVEQFLFRDLSIITNNVRALNGLPPCPTNFFNTISPYLYLAGTIPDFEYPRRDLPSQVHFTGPLVKATFKNVSLPEWWNDIENSDRPIILVTQGTVTTNSEDLIFPTLKAFEGENVLVVATIKSESNQNLPNFNFPSNARIASFIPFDQLLPHIDVMVTNGGFNGVQLALKNGVPVVASGNTEDKPEICARVQWSGVGINLKTQKPTSSKIKDAVNKILREPQYKARAKSFQQTIESYKSPSIAADLLEKLANTKQPVLRQD